MEMHLLREDGNTNAIRLYLLNAAGTEYEMLKLAGSEFSFDVDVSKMPCGMNGGLYFSEMAANGGKSDLNTAGAPYGTGYCDAACGVTPFVNGVVSPLHHRTMPRVVRIF
jgi:cellulase